MRGGARLRGLAVLLIPGDHQLMCPAPFMVSLPIVQVSPGSSQQTRPHRHSLISRGCRVWLQFSNKTPLVPTHGDDTMTRQPSSITFCQRGPGLRPIKHSILSSPGCSAPLAAPGSVSWVSLARSLAPRPRDLRAARRVYPGSCLVIIQSSPRSYTLYLMPDNQLTINCIKLVIYHLLLPAAADSQLGTRPLLANTC